MRLLAIRDDVGTLARTADPDFMNIVAAIPREQSEPTGSPTYSMDCVSIRNPAALVVQPEGGERAAPVTLCSAKHGDLDSRGSARRSRCRQGDIAMLQCSNQNTGK